MPCGTFSVQAKIKKTAPQGLKPAGASDYAGHREEGTRKGSRWFKGKVNFLPMIGASYHGSFFRVMWGQGVVRCSYSASHLKKDK